MYICIVDATALWVSCNICTKYSHSEKTMETRIIKTFLIKMKEDVGMSKPKKHANKVRWDPKLNKPLPYNPTPL